MIRDELNLTSLNDQQVMMLRLLKKPLPQEDFLEMQRLAVKLLAKQLDRTIEDWELQNGMVEEDYEKLSRGHFRVSSIEGPL
jgi:parvulin-like peptidyl-prolyl isomerase